MPIGAARLTLLAFQATVEAEADVIRKKVGVSANGNAQVDTAQSKFGGASALFDGSGDYLNASGPNLGSGAWTLEMFARFDSVAGVRVLYDDRESANSSNGTILLYTNGTTLYFNSQGANRISGGTLATNTWYHIAVVRDSSNDVKMYLDGTQLGSAWSDSSTYSQPDGNGFFGMNHQSPNNHYFDGYLDEIRFSNSARYPGAFTPSTAAFTNDDDTLLLLHMNGTDASTFFEDDNGDHSTSRTAVTTTTNGNAQVDTTRSKFGGASVLFDGTGDYITTSNDTQSEIGTGACTWECFFNVDTDTGSASSTIISNRTGGYSTGEVQMLFRNSDLKVQVNGNGTGAFSANAVGSALALDTWHHYAWARDASGNWAVFVNGSRVANGTGYTQELAAQGIGIGAMLDGSLPFNQSGNGWIDEVRISTTDRYGVGNTTYTVPISAFTNDANTLLLLHMNGEQGNTVFNDDNSVGRSQTSLVGQGNADHSSNESKFGRSSFYVDGSGGDGVLAYLPTNPTAITVEGWYKFNGVPSSKSCMFVHNRAATGYNANDWFVTYNYVLNDWSLNIKDSSGTTVTRINSTANNHENTDWHHMAVCMEIGGYARMFIDGNLEEEVDISSYTFTDWTGSLNRLWLGHWYSSGNNHSAYYDEFRISDSIRYTASFTAPTTTFVNDANTLLLFHADGQDNSTVFRDDNGEARTPCNFETIFGGELDTAQSKFGVSSWYNDADYDGAKMSDESPLDSIGTGAFTIECFVRKDTDITGLQYIFHGNNQQSLRYDDTNNTLEYCADNGETTRITGGALSNNTWYHVAVSRSGTTTKMFIDGTQTGSDYTGDDRSFANNTEYLLGVSRSGDSSWRGHIDEFRVSNTARYTEDFTAPTEPFQNDSNTLMLLHLDGTDASTVIIDDNGKHPPA